MLQKITSVQYSLILFDEATHFEWEQVEYLMSRLRSSAEGDSRMVLSCNPDPNSWVLPLIEWYLDDQGYPDPEKDGAIRYFVRKSGNFVWGETAEELMHLCTVEGQRPMTFQFISGTIYDNPPLIKENPAYLSFLEGLNDVDKARLLYGNWYARAKGANYFQREWLQKATEVPLGATLCRAWDKAAQEPNDVNRDPDYTASIKMAKCRDGYYYLIGDWDELSKEPTSGIAGRFRKRAGARDMMILNQCSLDGKEVDVILPKDPAAAGMVEYQESAKKLIERGYRTYQDPMPSNKSKLIRFQPFASAAQNGLVYIVESTFTNKSTLEAYLKELESFDGEASKIRHDDWVDCTASAFNYLSAKRVLPSFTLPNNQTINKDTRVSGLKQILHRG